jgi:hypothetical protein
MLCPNKEKNMQDCNCTYECFKKGYCCECIRYHRSQGKLPACYFPPDAERTYDRSVEHFISVFQKGRFYK